VEYRNLGRSGLKVSLVGLGCNNFGGRMDAEQTTAVINACLDAGITFFDTADVYGGGRSEEFMAAPLKAHRHDVVIATKAASPMGEGPYWRGTSRKYIVDAVDACLRRLDTDYIDLFQIHRPEAGTPEEENAAHAGRPRPGGQDPLHRQQQLLRLAGRQRCLGGEARAPDAVHQRSEPVQPPRAQHRGRAHACPVRSLASASCPSFPSPAASLTGKYRPNEPGPEGSRLTGDTPMSARFKNDKNYEGLTKLEKFAEERGHTMVELAMSWLATQPVISSVIAGATRPEQVAENAKAADWRLHPDEMQEIDDIMGVVKAGPMGGPPRTAPAR